MANKRIWKCGTNWGGCSTLDIVADFRIAFFGTDASRIGHYGDVRPGDLIGIAQGTRIIAIAEAMSQCGPLEEIGKEILPRNIIREYVYDSGVEPKACRVSNILWLEKPIINDRRGGRFYELKNGSSAYRAVLKTWEAHKNNPVEMHFDIDASKKVFSGKTKRESLFFGGNLRYVIPVYQRAYAWGENEILRLLDDIVDGAKSKEPRFIGSIQVSAPRKLLNTVDSYELIDGQQRLSTLLILLRHLGVDYTSNLRTVVNAGSAQRDWDDFREFFNEGFGHKFPLNKYVQASEIIKSWLKSRTEDSEWVSKEELVDYIEKSLYFVVIQTKAGISKTIQIFNVINTAGMDLDASDLFKIRFYEYLTKTSGPDEAIFAGISRCYQTVADYNREIGDEAIPMSKVISFFQKVLVAKFALNTELFSMSAQRFFEQLFDCLLEGKKWSGFYGKGIVMALQDLESAINILIDIDRKTKKYSRLSLFRNFLWETRYGNVVEYYPALACYFNTISRDSLPAMIGFAEQLFKKLVPPSLCFGKVVSDIRFSILHKLLLTFPQGGTAMDEILNRPWTARGVREDEMLNNGLNQEIADRRPWKNLACKLVEFLLSKSEPDKEVIKRLFDTEFDIEHIQSYEDDDDKEAIWREWDWEINGLGNLSMLEFSLNRSIRNYHEKKEEAYRCSHFVSIAKVRPLLNGGRWSLEQAQTRRRDLTRLIKEYILGKYNEDDVR